MTCTWVQKLVLEMEDGTNITLLQHIKTKVVFTGEVVPRKIMSSWAALIKI